MRIPVLSLLILIASPALGATQAYSEDCRPWFFDKVKSGLEEAGGVVGSRSDFPTGILVMPASGQIQKIVVRVWSVYECRLPKIVFYVEGDDIDAGTLRGVVTVAQAVFLEVAASEADMTTSPPKAWSRWSSPAWTIVREHITRARLGVMDLRITGRSSCIA
jgi:hypothetical protein